MTEDWYAASLSEVDAFLGKFEKQKSVTVKVDSDLVAALVGVLSAGPLIYAMAQHAHEGVRAAALLEMNPPQPEG